MQYLKLILFGLLQLMVLRGMALDRTVKSARLIADTSGLWFLNGVLPVGYELTYDNGNRRRTTGFLNGNLGWNKCSLKSDQAELKGGYFIIDLEKAEANQRSVVIELSMSEPSILKQYTFKLPELTAIAVLVPKNQKVMPGVKFHPEVNFSYSNGRRYQCVPWNKESFVQGDKLQLYVNQDLAENGLVSIPENILEAGDRVTLSILWKANRSLFDVRMYTLEYEFVRYFRYAALPGTNGIDGMDGSDNQKGMVGGDGQPGQKGKEVDVFMWLDDSDKLLHMFVRCGDKEDQVLLKPGIGKVEIQMKGGLGGDGGDGGKGGKATRVSGEMETIGGDGGKGGDGGMGGTINIWCDSTATKYLSQLNINNLGGAGGFGGKGGKGGRLEDDHNSYLISMLFPTRNSPGLDGENGKIGPRGPEATIYIESVAAIRSRVKK